MSSLLLPSLEVRLFPLNFFGCDIVEGFHGKTEFAVLDGNDFYFDCIADCQDLSLIHI